MSIDKNTLIYLGTGNPHKCSEIVSMMPSFRENFRHSPQYEVQETGKTFKENALIKARAYARFNKGGITIAEDSGICCSALYGAPGIYSARWSDCQINKNNEVVAHIDSGLSRSEIDKLNNEFVMNLHHGLNSPEERTASFEACYVVVDDTGSLLASFTGVANGYIALENKGTNGFGYDPIFVGDNTDGRTYAELDTYRKHLRSHRTYALIQLKEWLYEQI